MSTSPPHSVRPETIACHRWLPTTQESVSRPDDGFSCTCCQEIFIFSPFQTARSPFSSLPISTYLALSLTLPTYYATSSRCYADPQDQLVRYVGRRRRLCPNARPLARLPVFLARHHARARRHRPTNPTCARLAPAMRPILPPRATTSLATATNTAPCGRGRCRPSLRWALCNKGHEPQDMAGLSRRRGRAAGPGRTVEVAMLVDDTVTTLALDSSPWTLQSRPCPRARARWPSPGVLSPFSQE